MTLCPIDLSLFALPFTYFFTLPLCLIPFDRLPKHTVSNINQYHFHYHVHHHHHHHTTATTPPPSPPPPHYCHHTTITTTILGLMQVGFGEAGATMIAKNLADSSGGTLNFMGGGTMIKSIFGFCDVRQFTDTTECLQVTF